MILKTGLCALMAIMLTACTSDATLKSNNNVDENPGNQIVILPWEGPGSLDNWSTQQFSGMSRYKVVKLEDQWVLNAETDNTASALYRIVNIDLDKTPVLEWSWQVDNIYPELNHLEKSGDDYPIRLYLIFQDGFSPLEARAINYVWASTDTDREYWPNPYNNNSMMKPLRSGSDQLGQWYTERRNVKHDFLRMFGEEISDIYAIAIMSDSDNSGQNATAHISDLIFSSD